MLLNVEDVASETTSAIEEIDGVLRFDLWADILLVYLALFGLKKALLNQYKSDGLIIKIFNIVY